VKVAIDAGKATTFKVFLVYSGSLEPFPKEIPMNGRQLVRYYSNAYFYSPYTTANQRSTVKLASSHLEGHSETPTPVKVSGDTVTFGAYADVKPFSHASLWLHFENHAPFITVSKMVKEYEVSHWGNLAVEQALDVRHDGAALKVYISLPSSIILFNLPVRYNVKLLFITTHKKAE
jgi:oligosaccharyltransferase complex subunit alpha (ribophorin I)